MAFGEKNMKRSGPKAKDAELWVLIWEEVHRTHQGVQREVEHVKAHFSMKETQEMTLFERSVTEGIERADGLAKDGAMLDGGEMAQLRASTVQRREEEYAASQCAAGCHCLVEEWHDCAQLKHTPNEK